MTLEVGLSVASLSLSSFAILYARTLRSGRPPLTGAEIDAIDRDIAGQQAAIYGRSVSQK